MGSWFDEVSITRRRGRQGTKKLRIGHPVSSPPGSCVIRLLVRMVAGADQRPGLDVAEAEAQSLFFQVSEFIRRVKARNRQMVARGAQILSDGKNIDPPCGKVAKDVNPFGHGFAEPNH